MVCGAFVHPVVSATRPHARARIVGVLVCFFRLILSMMLDLRFNRECGFLLCHEPSQYHGGACWTEECSSLSPSVLCKTAIR